MLDFSQRHELKFIAELVASVQRACEILRVSTLIVGALARDLHVRYRYGIDPGRETEDVDFGFAVDDWSTFHNLRTIMLDSGEFSARSGALHRLHHKSSWRIDLVPFSGVETADRQIAWPPDGDTVMNVFGFTEALAAADEVTLPDGVRVKVVSLPALALLKLVAWEDRHLRAPGKDARDLMLIMSNYLDLGNGARLWDEFLSWTEARDFDYERAGARMLGHDVRALLDSDGAKRMRGMLLPHTDPETGTTLPTEMYPHNTEKALSLLEAFTEGLLEAQGR